MIQMDQIRFTLLLFVTLLGPIAVAQTPISAAFANLHSTDPNVAAAAGPALLEALTTEWSTIEQDTATICNALRDPDPYIRLQATAILAGILRLGTAHSQIVTACGPNLIVAGSDQVERVRNNALYALVMNPLGTPLEAKPLLIKSLASSSLRTSELGAAGLLKVKDGPSGGNDQQLVIDALHSADAPQRQNLLYAIGGARVASPALFEAAQRYLNDENQDVQKAAIEAVAASAPNKSEAGLALEAVANTNTNSADVKTSARTALLVLKGQD